MKSWSESFRRRAERRRRARRVQIFVETYRGLPVAGLIAPGGAPPSFQLAQWQRDFINRIAAEHTILRERVRCPGRRLP